MPTKNKMVLGIRMLAFAILGFAQVALAESVQSPIKAETLEDLIKNIIVWALGLTAVVAVGYVVYGGFLYITAGGDSKQLEAGKQAIIGAVIGIVVIGLAYAIVQAVVTAMGGGGSGSNAGQTLNTK